MIDIDRDKVLSQAADHCMEDLYEYAQPKVKWKDFLKQCKEYNMKYYEWERWFRAKKNKEKYPDDWSNLQSIHPDWGDKVDDCIGPRPFEFYYLPKEILRDIYESYVHAYRIDRQKELLDTIDTLKSYSESPIVNKWIPDEKDEEGNIITRGYSGYAHPDNLKKEITKIIQEYDSSSVSEEISERCCKKFFEFLDMAGNFFNWNREINSFGMSVYLGPSPNSNKDAVIKNWKKYRNTDIEIDEDAIKREYYGEDYDEYFDEEEE